MSTRPNLGSEKCPFCHSLLHAGPRYTAHVTRKCPKLPSKTISPEWVQKGINGGTGEYRNIEVGTVPDLELLVSKVNALYSDLVGTSMDHVPESVLKPEAAAPMFDRTVSSLQHSPKHATQNVSIATNLIEKVWKTVVRERGDEKDYLSLVELGCGKAHLSSAVGLLMRAEMGEDQYQSTCNFLLVDRMSVRLKADTRSGFIAKPCRVTVDITDLDLSRVPHLRGRQILSFAKHLCGSGTDVSLRCLIGALKNGCNVVGCAIATCCHHQCDVDSMVGSEALLQRGWTKEELTEMFHLGAWATSQKPGSPQQAVGIKIKRIVDFLRAEYLRSHGFEVEFVTFCHETEHSPENMLLLAFRHKLGSVPEGLVDSTAIWPTAGKDNG